MSRIAHIYAFSRFGKELKFYIDYLEINEEQEDSYIVKENGEGIAPRSNWLSKEIDLDAADDGYASLNLPSWVKVEFYETSGTVYVLENEIEKGKEILKETFRERIDEQIQQLEKMKKIINDSK